MRRTPAPSLLRARLAQQEAEYSIADHLRWAATTLAVEARRTQDERTTKLLLAACASVVAIARAVSRLDTLDFDNERELAGLLAEVCADLGACFEDGIPALAGFGEATPARPASTTPDGGNDMIVSSPRQRGGWRRRPLCLHLDHDARGAARLTVTGARTHRGRSTVSVGVDLLRAFVAQLSGSRDLHALKPGVSISVLLR